MCQYGFEINIIFQNLFWIKFSERRRVQRECARGNRLVSAAVGLNELVSMFLFFSTNFFGFHKEFFLFIYVFGLWNYQMTSSNCFWIIFKLVFELEKTSTSKNFMYKSSTLSFYCQE